MKLKFKKYFWTAYMITAVVFLALGFNVIAGPNVSQQVAPSAAGLTGDITMQAATHLVLPLHNDATTPTLAFGDRNTGLYESTDNVLRVSIAGTLRWEINSTSIKSTQSGGPYIGRSVSSSTVPTLAPDNDDTNTGIGHAAADQLSLIAGGVEGQRVTEASRTIETTATVGENDGGKLRIVTTADHALKVDDVVQFAAGTLPTGIVVSTNYYVTAIDTAKKFNLATSRGGTEISYTDTGTAFTSYELEITINQYGDVNVDGAVGVAEITTPSAVANYGKLYTKSDNILYFQDGEGVEHILGGDTPSFKSYMVTTQGLGANPDVYAGGFYEAPAADADLTQANLTQTLGTANKAEGAHVFLVASAVGTTDGSDLVVTVTGISITDAGARNGSDSEVIVADATAMATDQYFETAKKWLGQVTYTLSSTAGSTYATTFNYGFCKYDDYGNRDFKVTDFEVCGFAGANDNDLDIILYHHSSAGWTYHATAFVPGGTVICQLSADYSTDDKLVSAEAFAYKRTGLATSVTGSGSEGIVVDIITTANNAIEYATIIVGSEL